MITDNVVLGGAAGAAAAGVVVAIFAVAAGPLGIVSVILVLGTGAGAGGLLAAGNRGVQGVGELADESVERIDNFSREILSRVSEGAGVWNSLAMLSFSVCAVPLVTCYYISQMDVTNLMLLMDIYPTPYLDAAMKIAIKVVVVVAFLGLILLPCYGAFLIARSRLLPLLQRAKEIEPAITDQDYDLNGCSLFCRIDKPIRIAFKGNFVNNVMQNVKVWTPPPNESLAILNGSGEPIISSTASHTFPRGMELIPREETVFFPSSHLVPGHNQRTFKIEKGVVLNDRSIWKVNPNDSKGFSQWQAGHRLILMVNNRQNAAPSEYKFRIANATTKQSIGVALAMGPISRYALKIFSVAHGGPAKWSISEPDRASFINLFGPIGAERTVLLGKNIENDPHHETILIDVDTGQALKARRNISYVA